MSTTLPTLHTATIVTVSAKYPRKPVLQETNSKHAAAAMAGLTLVGKTARSMAEAWFLGGGVPLIVRAA